MILMQSIYQIVEIVVIFVFHFRGLEILGIEDTNEGNLIVKTLMFNAFVFAQIFNSVNRRRLDSHPTIFEAIFKNCFFTGITLLGSSIILSISGLFLHFI